MSIKSRIKTLNFEDGFWELLGPKIPKKFDWKSFRPLVFNPRDLFEIGGFHSRNCGFCCFKPQKIGFRIFRSWNSSIGLKIFCTCGFLFPEIWIFENLRILILAIYWRFLTPWFTENFLFPDRDFLRKEIPIKS